MSLFLSRQHHLCFSSLRWGWRITKSSVWSGVWIKSALCWENPAWGSVSRLFPVDTQKHNYPVSLGRRLAVTQDALSSCLCNMPSRDCSLNMPLRIGGACDFIRVWHHVCTIAQSLLCSLWTENRNLHLQYCHMKDNNLGANTVQITSLLAKKQVIKRGWS